MTAFKIGGTPIKPVSGASQSKKPEAAAPEGSVSAPKSGFDTAAFRPFAAVPRIGGAAGGKEAERTRSAAVESLLRDSSEEIDDYFASAYGFKE